MDDDLGFEIRQRAYREVQNALRPVIDEIVSAIKGQAVEQISRDCRVGDGSPMTSSSLRERLTPSNLVRVERPTIPKFAKMTVPDKSDWTRMISFGRDVDTWSIHNQSTTDLYYAYSNNASDFNTLGADGFEAKDTRPAEIWVKRAVSGNTVNVLIEWWEYEPYGVR